MALSKEHGYRQSELADAIPGVEEALILYRKLIPNKRFTMNRQLKQ